MAKIKKLPSGRYNVRVYLGRDESGKVISKSFTGSDKALVKAQAQEYERTHKGKERVTVGEMIDRYIDARKAVLSPVSVKGYISMRNTLKARYEPFFASTEVNKSNVNALAREMLVSGNAVKTIRNYLGLISAAISEYDIPMPRVRLPERAPRKVYSPTIETVKKILQTVKGTELEVPVVLGVCGLRRGEIVALDMDHVDGNSVRIEFDIVEAPDGSHVKKQPKTPQSIRTVGIPESLAGLIRKQGYVTKLSLHDITNKFSRMLKKNDLPHCRFHDLRRFYAAYMHSEGYSDAAIMEAGGWKTDAVMKNVYRYALTDDEVKKEMARSVAALV